MQYRREIDGLRAIAVIPVILFHAKLMGVTGGYVGVDVFFVISGYLITSILIGEIEENRFSIVNFYERRARRILPALTIVLLVTTIAAYILMPAELLRTYSQSLVSVSTFLSNVYFYLTSGYFFNTSDEKPLLHTWSLAVEEQYYIFFPLVLSMFWVLSKRKVALFLFSVSILSLLLAQYLSLNGFVDANFYLIFSRMWELFAGSLLVMSGVQNIHASKAARNILSGIGLGLILVSVFVFDTTTPFPSFYALVPVIGTCLILVFCDKTTVVGRLLSNRILVGIGLISYSLYLWHQPLFAFLRIKTTIGAPGETAFLAAIALSFILSILSYRYVETPFRNKKLFTRRFIFVFSISSILIFLTIGWFGHLYRGYPARFPTVSSILDSARYNPLRDECDTHGRNYLTPKDACRYFSKDVTWAVLGNSYAVELSYALAKLLEPYGKGLLHLSFDGCAPVLRFEVKNPGCTKWINESVVYLENNHSIKNIVLAFRFAGFLYGDQLGVYPELPNRDPVTNFVDFPKNLDPREEYWQDFRKIIDRLLTSGKKVYVLYPVPELPEDINKLVSPFSIFSKEPAVDIKKTTTARYYFERNKFMLEKLNTLSYGKNLRAIKTFEILCDSGYCPAVKDNVALYFDDNHLSVEGARLLLSRSVIARDLASSK